jgi:hypothetical protein
MTLEDIRRRTDENIARRIHYPECWDDIGGYPTLASALWEMLDHVEGVCPTCQKPMAQRNMEPPEPPSTRGLQ